MKWLVGIALLAIGAAPAPTGTVLLRPAAVFDGIDRVAHPGWQVLVTGERIVAVGPMLTVPANAETIDLPGETLMPGMIEGHGHLFLHPYNEASWDDQVLHEPLALRTARATVSARATLLAGFTTERDLGTEGAGYADVGLKLAIAQDIVPGPRMLVATRAIVAKGAYGPKGFEPGTPVPQGAEEASGVDDVVRVVRSQIAAGADVVKLYGDYRWGPGEPSRATFSQAEMTAAVSAAHDAGRIVAVHTSTPEGMRRAIAAGADTIEHGYGGTVEIFRAMAARGIALCPTLAASDAVSRYRGWTGGNPVPAAVVENRAAFALARSAGVPICMGGDVGVFAHGDNAREMTLMVEAGMPVAQVLLAATSGNARAFHLSDRGSVKAGMLADMIAMHGNPLKDIAAVGRVDWVMKGGRVVRP
ncbi:amidohydrolase family protein [Sphingomonas sp. TREG-RG-20F-R18-01]|uniref:metal-dependent hydrolase family protein n=1 Tax=Sphingomonas sp. TREG-RG-20F-R18-01 TaxID=2914982 RepID=UPI001F57C997|nr:amidohydrolase family protein [Sphingomonas sp. TREG-RG-20F-R18-01]